MRKDMMLYPFLVLICLSFIGILYGCGKKEIPDGEGLMDQGITEEIGEQGITGIVEDQGATGVAIEEPGIPPEVLVENQWVTGVIIKEPGIPPEVPVENQEIIEVIENQVVTEPIIDQEQKKEETPGDKIDVEDTTREEFLFDTNTSMSVGETKIDIIGGTPEDEIKVEEMMVDIADVYKSGYIDKLALHFSGDLFRGEGEESKQAGNQVASAFLPPDDGGDYDINISTIDVEIEGDKASMIIDMSASLNSTEGEGCCGERKFRSHGLAEMEKMGDDWKIVEYRPMMTASRVGSDPLPIISNIDINNKDLSLDPEKIEEIHLPPSGQINLKCKVENNPHMVVMALPDGSQKLELNDDGSYSGRMTIPHILVKGHYYLVITAFQKVGESVGNVYTVSVPLAIGDI